ncbi:MAG TPA: hypothetical protein DIW23_00660 [Anaerolineae bacterium]|nr:hypothetical protein [Anaerolineae bacterium]
MSANKVIYCSNCGQANPADGKFCGNCGSSLTKSAPHTAPTPAPVIIQTVAQPAKSRSAGSCLANIVESLVGLVILSGILYAGYIYFQRGAFQIQPQVIYATQDVPNSNAPSNDSNNPFIPSNPSNSEVEPDNTSKEETNIYNGIEVVDFGNCPQTGEITQIPEIGPLNFIYKLCLSGFTYEEWVHVKIIKSNPLMNESREILMEFDIQIQTRGGVGAITFNANTSLGFTPGFYTIIATGQISGKESGFDSVIGASWNHTQLRYESDISQIEEIIHEFWEVVYSQLFQNSPIYVRPEFYRDPTPPYGCKEQQEYMSNNATSCGIMKKIVWDDTWVQTLYNKYGPVFPFWLLGHEWGHQIQQQSGTYYALVEKQLSLGVVQEQIPFALSKEIELGADCYSGAAFAYAVNYHGYFDSNDVLIMLHFAEQIDDPRIQPFHTWVDQNNDGIPEEHDSVHGVEIERGFSFLYGYRNGPNNCH